MPENYRSNDKPNRFVTRIEKFHFLRLAKKYSKINTSKKYVAKSILEGFKKAE